MNRRTAYLACAVSLAIGVFFVLVWSPQPWGWEGIDGYHDLGLQLAHGAAYPTLDRPWGYALFLAPFYRLFGNRPVVPLLAQVALNALLPLIVYEYARTEFDERVAGLAALLTGILSFNTVYASTQSSDAVCNVLFMAAVLAITRARRSDEWQLYVAAGVLFGIAPQFRPNLILVPLLLAVVLAMERRTVARIAGAGVVVLAAGAALLPWIVRTERLTGEFMPTSTHGGVQLWYGSLQTGAYLENYARNPRSVFETPTFHSTSLQHAPIVVSGQLDACRRASTIAVVYWTDRDGARHRVTPRCTGPRGFEAELPAMPAPTTLYLYVDGVTPSYADAPEVFFVSTDHLGDLDRHGDLLDVFDVVRLMRHVAFGAPVSTPEPLDIDGDGRLTGSDVRMITDALLADGATPNAGGSEARIDSTPDSATLRLVDGSTLTAPRAWSGRVTDLEVRGSLAASILHSTVPVARRRDHKAEEGPAQPRLASLDINAPFYLQQTQAMRRYFALAIDNIRREPAAYAASCLHRALRIFVVQGSDDPNTAQQFAGSGRVYQAAHAVSLALFVLFGVGIVAAWRQGASIAIPLLLIAYVPATLAFVLTNMRYSIAVQPLMFVFVASALAAAPAGHRATPTARAEPAAAAERHS